MIDLSSEFRYQDHVPLVIPEVNGGIVKELNQPTLIANPNCSVSQLLVALNPIHQEFKVDILNIATYQAVSGTGKKAIEELKNQIKDISYETNIYPKKIAFNVIPQCDVFLENDFTNNQCISLLNTDIDRTQFIADLNILIQELTKN